MRRHFKKPGRSPRFIESLENRVHLSVNMLTYHNDNTRDGLNANETILTTANVNSTSFGKLFWDQTDGQIYAQPLVMTGVNVPNVGTKDLVFIATQHDSVYAFDANTLGGAVWHDSFINPAAGVTTVPYQDVNSDDITPEIGITGTPVIDQSTNTLFVVAKTKEVSTNKLGITITKYVQRLHALDLATGAEKFGGPVVIAASVPGTGAGTKNGVVSFNALRQNQRCALLLQNGTVYICWASHGDNNPYHGWIIGYAANTLQQTVVFNDCPDGTRSGIWMSGGAPAVDSDGNIYVSIGNGTFDRTEPRVNYGDSILKLTPNGAGGLDVTSFFAPFNEGHLSNKDVDLGSGGVLLLPDFAGTHPHELIEIGKQGRMYVLNRDDLGGFNVGGDKIIEETKSATNSCFDTPAYFNGTIYTHANFDYLRTFAVNVNGHVSKIASVGTSYFGFPGDTPSISANGKTNGIVWEIERGASSAVLHATDAANVAVEQYNSSNTNGRDALGGGIKFAVPTVVNGKVYVGTATGLSVFGLLNPPAVQIFSAARVPTPPALATDSIVKLLADDAE